MALVSTPLVVRIFINTAQNGWSERWPIWVTDWNQGVIVAGILAQARRLVLCSNASIVWASLATITPPYIEQAVLSVPLMPLPQWGPNAGDMQGVLFDFFNEAGNCTDRLLRAVDTTEYGPGYWIRQYLPLPVNPPPLPVDLTMASKDLLWQNMLATFARYISTCTPVGSDDEGPDQFDVVSMPLIGYNNIRSRRVGAPYRRASWESMARSTAPAFSPCGVAVTVLRRCYQEPCRFYADEPPVGIRYYWAPPGAAVLTIPTIFYGWARAKENVYHGGPGETAQFKKAFETDGYSFSSAPGVAITGTPADFLGQGVVTWSPYRPTPLPLRPACDTPPPVIAAAGGGPAWGGAGGNPVDVTGFLLQEDGSLLLQEDGSNIIVLP